MHTKKKKKTQIYAVSITKYLMVEIPQQLNDFGP